MRVVFLTHNYPRHRGDLPGTFLHPLAQALRSRGHDLRVVAPSDAGAGGADVLDGVPVTRVRYAAAGRERYAYTGRMTEMLRSPAGWVALAGMHRALRAAARREAAGAHGAVVHAHWWIPAGLAAPPELPCVVTMHGTDARLLARWPAARLLARKALRSPRVVTAVSRSVAALAAKATGRPIDDAHTSPMPVEGTVRASRGGAGLVFVGRLTEQKRPDLLLRAMAALRRPSLELTVVGDGPLRSRLEDLAGSLGLKGRVRFAGLVPPVEVQRLLTDADAFVLPALEEGLGLAAIEALFAGVPIVVCRDGGGLLDVAAEPGAGLVVEPTVTGVAAGILATLQDPATRSRAYQAGLSWAGRLAPSQVAARCEDWYAEAIGG